jgi:hypothetical protein
LEGRENLDDPLTYLFSIVAKNEQKGAKWTKNEQKGKVPYVHFNKKLGTKQKIKNKK